MLKIEFLIVIFCLVAVNSFASNQDASLSFDNFNEIHLDVKRTGSKWTFDVRIVNDALGLEAAIDLRKEAGAYRYTLSENAPFTKLDWDRISCLKVKIESASAHPFSRPSDTLRLDTIAILQELPISDLSELNIDLSDYYGYSTINLEKWKQFHDWFKYGSFKAFTLNHGLFLPVFDLSALYRFPLIHLKVPLYLTDEVLRFPYLETIEAYGIFTNVNHYLSQLEDLNSVKEYGGRYDNSFETLHAERYFYTVLTASRRFSEIGNSPFSELLQLEGELFEIEYNEKKGFLKDLVKSADVMVYENDFPNYSGNTPENDTLMAGQIKRRKLKGVWTFKLKDQYTRNDKEKHHVNFSQLPKLNFPVNGTWSLEYINGNTAIEGLFVNGRKNGDWKYYNEEGTLRSTKSYRNDTLVFNKVQFNLHGNNLESRTYFASMNEIYQSIYFPDEQKVKLNVLYYDGGNPAYRVNSNGLVAFRKKGEMYAQNISKTSEKYQTLIREGIIDKLFPEHRNQELPFIVE
ncbi:MAG: toxin-antitoxin system YwqK family antitoxin [Fluviicola sp.]